MAREEGLPVVLGMEDVLLEVADFLWQHDYDGAGGTSTGCTRHGGRVVGDLVH